MRHETTPEIERKIMELRLHGVVWIPETPRCPVCNEMYATCPHRFLVWPITPTTSEDDLFDPLERCAKCGKLLIELVRPEHTTFAAGFGPIQWPEPDWCQCEPIPSGEEQKELESRDLSVSVQRASGEATFGHESNETAATLPGEGGGAKCYDCKLPYDNEGFADLVVPHDVWLKISPTGHGGGLLCPTCLVRRAEKAGLTGITAKFMSGPFAPIAVASGDGLVDRLTEISERLDLGCDVTGAILDGIALITTLQSQADAREGEITGLREINEALREKNKRFVAERDEAHDAVVSHCKGLERQQATISLLRAALEKIANEKPATPPYKTAWHMFRALQEFAITALNSGET